MKNSNQGIQESFSRHDVKQKGYLLPIVGVIFLSLIVGGGAYYLGTTKNSKQIQTQPIVTNQNNKQNETANTDSIEANWKTYTNTKYSFEFKYPGDHTAYTSTDQNKPALIPATSKSDVVNIAAEEDMLFCCEAVKLSFSVKSTTINAQEWVKEYLSSNPDWQQELPIIKNITFAGKTAVEANGRGGYGPPYRLIVVPLNGSLLLITQNLEDSLLNQVLSTFKFN